MSKFFSAKFDSLTPYVPGEQPRDTQYIKLNTNECPYNTSLKAAERAAEEAKRLRLYSDPECTDLVAKAAELFGVEKDEIVFTNGSDEALNFAVMAFCDEKTPAMFPDITYGFYPVICQLNNIPYTELPLNEDLTICQEDYYKTGKTIFLANPNAPTGIALSLPEIEKIIQENPDTVVIVDEAYVDFGGESAIPLIKEFDNLVVVRTFSKSLCGAGQRLGYIVSNPKLIECVTTVKNSFNHFPVDFLTQTAGIAACSDVAYYVDCAKKVASVRDDFVSFLRSKSWFVIDSCTNFVFAKKDGVPGEETYRAIKADGILVRHFSTPGIEEFLRITIGTEEQMEALKKIMEKI